MEGNLRFKIDWTSLLLGSKLTTFALFYFVFEGNFASTSIQGAYVWRGDLMEGFLCYWFGGLILRRGLFSEVYGMQNAANDSTHRIWLYNVAVTCIDYTVLHQLRTYYIYFFVCRCLM